MRHFLLFLILLFSSSLLFSQAGTLRYVVVHTEELKENSTTFSRTLGNLSMGDSVSLIREDRNWSQVRTETLTGWVRSSSLTTRRVLGPQAVGFYSTHPSTRDRMTNVEGAVRRYRVEDTGSHRVPRFRDNTSTLPQ